MNPTSRSVGRYRPGAALLAGVAGLTAILGVLASPGDASPRPEPLADPAPLRIGMNSCGARGCHGAVDATDPGHGQVYIKDGAYTTWLNYDPHARAYAVLLEKRSVEIARKLKGTLNNQPAHRAELCLSCHATVGPAKDPDVAPPSDGISCEACHGPAEHWQDAHLAPKWRADAHGSWIKGGMVPFEGMTNLTTPTARARTCVRCHVGDRSRGMDMNHDLIAAGHPRLNFEFASYLSIYPKHWKEKGPGEGFEANNWAIGQVVTAQAVLDLVSDRALASTPGGKRVAPAPEAVWPEFSEYECFACHHDLTKSGPRQKSGHSPGRLPWQIWPGTMLPELAKGRPGISIDTWTELQSEMGLAEPKPAEVARLAALGKEQLGTLLTDLEVKGLSPIEINALLNQVSPGPFDVGVSWDRVAQRYLALQALVRDSRNAGRAIGPTVEQAIKKYWEALEFPEKYDSPRNKR